MIDKFSAKSANLFKFIMYSHYSESGRGEHVSEWDQCARSAIVPTLQERLGGSIAALSAKEK